MTLETGTQEGTGGDSGAVDVDGLLSGIDESTNQDRPMSAPPAEEKAAKPGKQALDEIEFTWNGKPIKASMDKVKLYAQQGYDYAQKMAEFKKNQEAFTARETEFKTLEQKWSPYKQVDEYFAQNPDKWQKIQAEFQAHQAGVDPNDPSLKVLEKIQPELNELKKFKQDFETDKHFQKRQQDDAKLGEEISSIRKAYPNLPLDTPDESGKSLEFRVLEYAQQHGLRSFEQAFKLFNHDRITQLAAEQAKEAVGKEVQRKTKLGLLGKSSAPTKGFQTPKNIKNMSYEDILQEAIAEMQG